MSLTKSELRESLKQTRLELGADVRRNKSLAIAASLLRAVDWSGVRTLHCYEPIARLGEVDLASFLTDLRETRPAIRVYTSRKIGGEWQIVPMYGGESASGIRFDAVIVPMLGFEPRTLHRIGYGGGHYDKFLADQRQAQKIGVCFEAGQVDKLPAEPHDVPLDMIITERAVYGS